MYASLTHWLNDSDIIDTFKIGASSSLAVWPMSTHSLVSVSVSVKSVSSKDHL
jgi:hypothetical protein